MPEIKTIKQALDYMCEPHADHRWEMLAFVLRELALAQGIDINHEVEHSVEERQP